MHIANWSASRSGAGLAVRGIDTEDSNKVHLFGIKKIEARGGQVIAISRDGFEHVLLVG